MYVACYYLIIAWRYLKFLRNVGSCIMQQQVNLKLENSSRKNRKYKNSRSWQKSKQHSKYQGYRNRCKDRAVSRTENQISNMQTLETRGEDIPKLHPVCYSLQSCLLSCYIIITTTQQMICFLKPCVFRTYQVEPIHSKVTIIQDTIRF